MPYRLKRKQSVQKNLRRIAHEQIHRALEDIDAPDYSSDQTVHQVRKRCKKLRGLIRLVRHCFSDYHSENRLIRDTARELSDLRDARTLLDTFNSLAARHQDRLDPLLAVTIRERLEQNHQDITQNQHDIERRLARFSEQMKALDHRVNHWRLDAAGFDAIHKGLRKNYRQGRKAMRKAYAKPTAAHFHEWRKRTKYLWYHSRLLQRIWPRMLEVQMTTADELGNLLGDEHDLAVLANKLNQEKSVFTNRQELTATLELITQQRKQLQQQCWLPGRRLYTEKPGQLPHRLHGYWETWHKT